MAFNYFSKQLLGTDKINLSEVFPEKQQVAKDKQRVSYGLEDVVLYLKDATEDFKFYDPKYAELDNGIRDVVDKYFISIGKENPFVMYGGKKQELTPEYKKGIVPKESMVVDKAGVKGKGITAPSEELVEETPQEAVKKVAIETAETALMSKIDKFKKELANRQDLMDDYVSIGETSEKDDMIRTAKNQLQGLKDLIEDDLADDFDKERYTLLSDFIQKNS